MFYLLFAFISGGVMTVLMFALTGEYFGYKKKMVLPLTEIISKMEAEVNNLHTKLDAIKNNKKG